MPLIYQPPASRNPSLSLPRLREILDRIRCSTSPSGESLARLRSQRVAAMRLLLRSSDADDMTFFLSLNLIEQEMCARLFAEENPSDIDMRFAVMRYLTRISPAENGAVIPDPSSGSGLSVVFDAAASFPPEEEDPNFSDSAFSPSGESSVSLMEQCALRLGIRHPSLRLVLGQMPIEENDTVNPAGTDRRRILVNSGCLLSTSEERDLFLHMIMHCIFGHMRIPAGISAGLWDLAADISAEYTRRHFFPDSGALPPLLTKLPPDLHPENAAEVCRWLNFCLENDVPLPEEDLIRRDDHTLWYRAAEESGKCASGPSDRDWQNALALQGPQSSRRRGFAPGSREDKILLREAERRDFRRYLRRFSTVREEIQTDYDSFDYIPYHYGILMNPDLPLFEPLEYTEANKVDQLAIAIDTSGSCDLPTVQSFLSEVHGILTQRESFFRRMEVHIFQCDSAIQDHTIIRSSEMWEKYNHEITICGRGGTDFTPVFREIRSIRAGGGLAHLRGLIYFTDGDGVYPRESPDYETAFVFSDDDYQRFHVPRWIVPLLLHSP